MVYLLQAKAWQWKAVHVEPQSCLGPKTQEWHGRYCSIFCPLCATDDRQTFIPFSTWIHACKNRPVCKQAGVIIVRHLQPNKKWPENLHAVPRPSLVVMCSAACDGPCQQTVYGFKRPKPSHALLQARRSCTPKRQRHRLHTASGIFPLQTPSSHPPKHDLLIPRLQQPARAL